MMAAPIVSVCMITYGHEQFIEQAILGVLQQKTNFNIELIIADDASPDDTEKVVERISQSHPNGKCIKYFRHQKNKGMSRNFIWALQKCTGKYVALCEGDDFWTNPDKLQIQVDYLEVNTSVAGCFHDAITVDEHGNKLKDNYFDSPQETYNQRDCLTKYGARYATCASMFRGDVLKKLPPWFIQSACDYTLDILITSFGDIAHINGTMAAYRIHSGGVWQGSNTLKNLEVTVSRHRILFSDKALRTTYGDFLQKNINTLSWRIVIEYRAQSEWRKQLKYSWVHFRYTEIKNWFAYKSLAFAFLYPIKNKTNFKN